MGYNSDNLLFRSVSNLQVAPENKFPKFPEV